MHTVQNNLPILYLWRNDSHPCDITRLHPFATTHNGQRENHIADTYISAECTGN